MASGVLSFTALLAQTAISSCEREEGSNIKPATLAYSKSSAVVSGEFFHPPTPQYVSKRILSAFLSGAVIFIFLP
jgi:hypothetical protein